MNRTNRHAAPAFTLIEVLMAVFILAIGILGIGALFPAVISLQRSGADATFGTLTSQTAQSYLSGHSNLPRSYWESWARLANSTLPAGGLWLVAPVDPVGGWAMVGQDDTLAETIYTVYIPLAERLYPTDASGAAEPLLVWDIASRRIADGGGAVQVALFSRRIDPKIRLPRGASAFTAMTDISLPTSDRRWPLSEDSTTGVPRLDGFFGSGARYSLPFTVGVSLADPRVRDSLTLGAVGTGRTQAAVFSQLSQQGQKIVDNYGNVYTVEGPDTRRGASRYAFKINPPVPPDSNTQFPVRPSQIVMTPQTPAAVVVFTVNP